MKRLVALAALIAGSTVLAYATIGASLGGDPDPDAAAATAPAGAVETALAERRDLTETQSVSGSVGHGGPKELLIEASGIITDAPAQDAVLRAGDEALRIDDRPVTVAQGTQPLYRELRRVPSSERDAAGDRVGLQTGPDVAQLQRYLLDHGYDDDGRLEADGIFGSQTERAVKAWQRDTGHPATGRVDRSQLVFTTGPVRVDSTLEVGDSFSQLSVTGVTPTVTLEVTAKQRRFFPAGTSVSVETDTATVQGVVTSSKRTTAADGSTSYEVEVELVEGTEVGSTEVVEVTASRVIAEDVVAVPVRALVALAEGGWAVQIADGDSVRLSGVQLGEVVDGMAEVTGIDEGTEVVVPT